MSDEIDSICQVGQVEWTKRCFDVKSSIWYYVDFMNQAFIIGIVHVIIALLFEVDDACDAGLTTTDAAASTSQASGTTTTTTPHAGTTSTDVVTDDKSEEKEEGLQKMPNCCKIVSPIILIQTATLWHDSLSCALYMYVN